MISLSPKHLALLVPGPGNLLGYWALQRHRAHREQLEWELSQWRHPLGGATAPAPLPPGGVVLLGASITEGFRERRLLPHRILANAGQGGQNASQLLLRFRRHVLDRRPWGVVIKLCSLNFLGHLDGSVVWDNLLSMIDLARHRGIQPILATVISVGRDNDREEGGGVAEGIAAFNGRLVEHCREQGLPLVDYHRVLSDRGGFLPHRLGPDGVHPSEEGYTRMARALDDLLTDLDAPLAVDPSREERHP